LIFDFIFQNRPLWRCHFPESEGLGVSAPVFVGVGADQRKAVKHIVLRS